MVQGPGVVHGMTDGPEDWEVDIAVQQRILYAIDNACTSVGAMPLWASLGLWVLELFELWCL